MRAAPSRNARCKLDCALPYIVLLVPIATDATNSTLHRLKKLTVRASVEIFLTVRKKAFSTLADGFWMK
jgi:hypothetical protein